MTPLAVLYPNGEKQWKNLRFCETCFTEGKKVNWYQMTTNNPSEGNGDVWVKMLRSYPGHMTSQYLG